jgi:sugar phosphate isomerase/epimerase
VGKGCRNAAGVSLSPLTVGRPDPVTMVAAAEVGGFTSIGLTLTVPGGGVSELCTDRRLRRVMSLRLVDTGISVLDVGAVVLGADLDTDKLRAVLETGRHLGASRLIALNQHEDPHRARAALAAVCDLAGSFDMLVGVEFMPYTATRSLTAAASLVSQVDAANAGVVLDALHLYRSGGTVADVASLSGPSLLLVQLCDARRASPGPRALRQEALTDRLYPGQGDLPLRRLLKALPADVPLALEAPTAQDAGRPAEERAVAAAASLRLFATDFSGGLLRR